VAKLLELVGTQIVLRDWELSDIEPWMSWMNPQHVWQEFDGPQFPPPTENKIREWRQSIEQGIRTSEWPRPRVNLPICFRSTDQFIGRVSGYWHSDRFCLGIDIYDPTTWRKGIGCEALGLWIDYLFRVAPELTQINLETWSGNIGMVRLAAKLGFAENVEARTSCVIRGHDYDSLVFAVSRNDWKAQFPKDVLLSRPES
jgi:RimJ/RimL family protein N-acetyltransferase